MGRFSRAAGHGEVVEQTAHALEAEEQRPLCQEVRDLVRCRFLKTKDVAP
jgi:hypothetical protein